MLKRRPMLFGSLHAFSPCEELRKCFLDWLLSWPVSISWSTSRGPVVPGTMLDHVPVSETSVSYHLSVGLHSMLEACTDGDCRHGRPQLRRLRKPVGELPQLSLIGFVERTENREGKGHSSTGKAWAAAWSVGESLPLWCVSVGFHRETRFWGALDAIDLGPVRGFFHGCVHITCVVPRSSGG